MGFILSCELSLKKQQHLFKFLICAKGIGSPYDIFFLVELDRNPQEINVLTILFSLLQI